MNSYFILLSLALGTFGSTSGHAANCVGSQTEGCEQPVIRNTSYFRCIDYKSTKICEGSNAPVIEDSCKVEDGELYCQVEAQTPPHPVSTRAGVLGMSADGSSQISYTAEAIDACVRGTSAAAQSSASLAQRSAHGQCDANSIIEPSEPSWTIRPSGAETAKCIAHVSFHCSK